MNDSGKDFHGLDNDQDDVASQSNDSTDSSEQQFMQGDTLSDVQQAKLLDKSRHLGFDPRIKHGKLVNGLTYFVKCNTTPRKRAELHLVMNVGSVDEMENEQGYAHFIEHLAFRESHGVAFGAHQNAYTSFDETVYELHVPLDEITLLPKFLIALRKFCFEIRLSERDIEQEKRIIVEEWRQSQGAAARLALNSESLRFAGTPYANRFPIGKMDVVNAATAESMRAFYERLYMPEAACIIAVGDFDNEELVIEHIQQVFGGVSAGGRNEQHLPIHARLTAALTPQLCAVLVQSSAEGCSSSFCIDFRHSNPPEEEWDTVGEFREYLIGRLLRSVCDERLQKIALYGDPPFAFGSCSPTYPHAMMWTTCVQIALVNKRTFEAIEQVLDILVSLRRDGLTINELERSKRQLLTLLERGCRMEDTIPSEDFCSDLKRHFLFRSCMPAKGVEMELAGLIMPTITQQEMLEYARSHLSFADNCVASLIIDDDNTFRLMDTTVKDMLARAEQAAMVTTVQANLMPTQSYDDEGLLDLSVNIAWPDGVVCEQKYDAVSDLHQIRFQNGVELVVKVTDFSVDEVLYGATAPGGLSEVTADDVYSCRAATTFAEDAGVFGIAPADLDDFFRETDIALDFNIDYYKRTIEGSCCPSDMERVFQLLFRLFTCDLIADHQRMQAAKKFMASSLDSASKDPLSRLMVTTNKLTTSAHPFFAYLEASDVQKIDVQKALNYFKRMYSDPSEFAFVIVGDVDLQQCVSLAAHYLASIPPIVAKEERLTYNTVQSLNWMFPDRSIHQMLHCYLEEEMSLTNIVMPVAIGGHTTDTIEGRNRKYLEFLRTTEVLERRLLEVFRFELGGVYGISVEPDMNKRAHLLNPTDPLEGTLKIQFACKPTDAPMLQNKVFDVIDSFIQDGPTAEEAQNALEADRLNFSSSERTNVYWLEFTTAGYQSARYKGNMGAFLTETFAIRRAIMDNIDAKIIQQSARDHLSHHRDHHILVCLLPNWRSRLIRDMYAQPFTYISAVCGVLAIAGVLVAKFATHRK